MAIDYKTAKQLLEHPTTRNIGQLEKLLEDDGFTEKLDPLNLSFSNWYFQNLAHRPPEERTDEITAYARGFLRKKGDLIAAYGIKKISDTYGALPVPEDKFGGVHFFYIKKNESKLHDILTFNTLWAARLAAARLSTHTRYTANLLLTVSQTISLDYLTYLATGSIHLINPIVTQLLDVLKIGGFFYINDKYLFGSQKKYLTDGDVPVLTASSIFEPNFGPRAIKTYNRKYSKLLA